METTITIQRPARTLTDIVCTRCHKNGQVPFTPTPGRPVLCTTCHQKAQMRPYGRTSTPRIPAPPRRRMLSMRWKGHFVHDALETLGEEAGSLEPDQRRAFVEMVFARGSRQTMTAALTFIDEKIAEGVVTDEQAARLVRLVEAHSRRR